MNKQQNAWYKRNEELIMACEAASAVWQGKPFFEEPYLEFKALHEQVKDAFIGQMRSPEGYTDVKKKRRTLLVAAAMELSRALTAYALVKKLEGMKEVVYRSPSKLARMADLSLAGFASSLVQQAAAQSVPLDAWGITAEKISVLEVAADLFMKSIEPAQTARKTRSSETRSLKELFARINHLLAGMLDAQAAVFATSYPDFHWSYQRARRARKPARHKRALELQVKDAQTKEALADVLVRIDSARLKRKTTAKGRLQADRLAPGEIKIICSKKGYKEMVQTAYIVSGLTTELQVFMERQD